MSDDGGHGAGTSDEPRVVPLNRPIAPPAPATPPNRLLALATTGMVVSAVTGILATLAFITIGWPGTSGRRVIAVVVLAVVAFMACASTAIIAAARDTSPRRPKGQH